MVKNVVKVSRSKGGFRLIVPHKIVKEMGWDDVHHITVEYHLNDFILIRRAFSGQEENRAPERS
jgi:hypothetical protein